MGFAFLNLLVICKVRFKWTPKSNKEELTFLICYSVLLKSLHVLFTWAKGIVACIVNKWEIWGGVSTHDNICVAIQWSRLAWPPFHFKQWTVFKGEIQGGWDGASAICEICVEGNWLSDLIKCIILQEEVKLVWKKIGPETAEISRNIDPSKSWGSSSLSRSNCNSGQSY